MISAEDNSEVKEQQKELRTLLLKWEKVFANHDEDFGQTDPRAAPDPYWGHSAHPRKVSTFAPFNVQGDENPVDKYVGERCH